MRVDGLLQVVPISTEVLPHALISRIKFRGPEIAECCLPQDGAAHLRVARADIDIRVATIPPTRHGEKLPVINRRQKIAVS